MLLRSKLLLALLVSGLALAAPRAEAVPTLDDFEAFTFTAICTDLTSPCPTSQAGIPTTNVLSGTRNSIVTQDASLSVAGGELDFNSSDADADFGVTYVFSSTIDLTVIGDRFLFDVLEATDVDNAIGIAIVDGSMLTRTASFMPVLGANEILFSAFTGSGSLLDVKEIAFGLSNDAAHLRLATVLVPEPTTAGMLLLGLAGLARAGRRENRSA